MRENIITKSDSYKITHWPQYPPFTTEVYSYFESRGGLFHMTDWIGLQYVAKRHLTGIRVTQQDIDEAEALFARHLGDSTLFNKAGWQHILADHGGRLPLEILALDEGSVVPTRTCLMTVRNTCEKCYWVTNYFETLLSHVWYPSTVATLSHQFFNMIAAALRLSGTEADACFKLQDFGFRGATSFESSGIAAAAHMLHFRGTDTISGIEMLMYYYNCTDMPGFSVPAAEHSTITSWGRDHEVDAYRNMLTSYPNAPITAVVSDSYNIYNACENLWGGVLRYEVLNRKGMLVIRPDSGDPPTVVLKCLEILGVKFGSHLNDKGYKVLEKVRVLQGDGIDLAMTEKILATVMSHGWSADNLVFGCGGGLHQKVDRDTSKYAFKCSHVVVAGEQRDVFKDPVTDAGKASKRGRLAVTFEDGQYQTIQFEDLGKRQNMLKLVYLNGDLVREATFSGGKMVY